MANPLLLLVAPSVAHAAPSWLDELGPFGPPVVAAIVGAVAGWIASIATVDSQEREKERYQARRVLIDALKLLQAYIEHQRGIHFPDVTISNGQIGIDSRVEFVVSTFRQTSLLGHREREHIEADIERLVGYQATFRTKDRAALPASLVNRDAEYAAKSLALIPEVKAGTFQRGLLEELARPVAGDAEHEPAAVACIQQIDRTVAYLRGRRWWRPWRG
ncbi:hypothetical protein ACFOYW_08340 [Gryllotalpicola reticulitermitis]|uniref:Uncharacterized protein n=1 Tax=Gryllotalpicola reticulitermitis TaxID=1184153 RepID=A0ABV8Q7E5_9MICO